MSIQKYVVEMLKEKKLDTNKLKVGDKLVNDKHPEWGEFKVTSIDTHDGSKIVNIQGRRGGRVVNSNDGFSIVKESITEANELDLLVPVKLSINPYRDSLDNPKDYWFIQNKKTKMVMGKKFGNKFSTKEPQARIGKSAELDTKNHIKAIKNGGLNLVDIQWIKPPNSKNKNGDFINA